MTALIQDLKFALRLIIKNPGFAAAAMIVLALGIGANSALFSVVNTVLIRPLPYEQPDRLMQLWHTPPPKSFPGLTQFSLAPANYLDWKAQNHVFESMAMYEFSAFNLTGRDTPESIRASKVNYNFFDVLRVRPRMGRVFLLEEDQPGREHVVVLSYGLWKNRFASDPNIVNKTIDLDGEPYTVVGVMGPTFRRPEYAQLWTPMALTDKQKAVRGEHHFSAVARLKPGVDVKQAQAELTTISKRLEQQYPEDDKDWGALVVPLREQLVADVRPALLVLLGAVAFVLLIACANVANLMLAKVLTRQKEIAIRTALGASRVRIVQQILAEAVLLSISGGALGLILAHFGVRLIVNFFGGNLPRANEIGLDGTVLAFTFAVSVLAGIVAGLAPALRLTKANVAETLKLGLGRTDSVGGGKRTRGALVVSEVALSLMLLIGAGLMVRSLWQLRGVDPGFDPRNALTMNLAVPDKQFLSATDEARFFDQVLQRIRTLPGVQTAGAVDDLPLVGGSNQPVAVEGAPPVPLSEQPEMQVRVITPGYISAMGIPLKRGRDIADNDGPNAPAVVLISESTAKRFWPNEDAIGKRLILSFMPDKVREVVGIVADVKQNGLDFIQTTPSVYYPLSQESPPSAALGGTWRARGMALVIRTSVAPGTVTSAATRAVHEMNRDLPVRDIMTLEDFISESLSQQHFNVLLLGAFAALALLLAALGIFSVLSYSVRRRVREIGIRMALGAQVKDVLRLVVVEGMKPTALGVVIGLLGALVLGRLLSSMMFGVSATDPITFAAVSVLLIGVAVFASLIPAYRATQVEPVRTLRDE
jgi:putative ABC transport system permease protein